MSLFLAICQGAGFAAAVGIRPLLGSLLAGALAGANVGVDFDHTDYAFLESVPFLVVVGLLALGAIAIEHRRGLDAVAGGPLGAALGGLAIGFGALLFAGSLADIHKTAWPGLVAGAACAAVVYEASRGVLAGAHSRLDRSAQRALPLYAAVAVVVLDLAAVAVPPLAALVVVLFAVLLARRRGRAGQKYAGLRILR